MADNLSINITADTASLRAQLAVAQADVRAYGAEVRKLAGELRGAGDEAKAGLQGQLLQAAESFERAGAAAAGFRGQLAPVKEAAHEGGSAFAELKSGALELAGVFGVAFGAEKILESIKQLAEMGEKTENIAAAIGTTPARFSELAGALKLVGGDAEAAQRSIRQLERNIEAALEDPKSKQALNFGALGINRGQLEAAQRDVIGFLEGPFADAYKKFVVDSVNPGTGTAEFTELMGRGMQNLIPLIKEGSTGVAELILRAKGLGVALTDSQIKDLAESAKILNEVGAAFVGLQVKIFEEFKQPIDESAKSMRDFLKDGQDVITFLHGLSGALKEMPHVGPLFMPGAPGTTPELAPPPGFEEGGEETEKGRRYRENMEVWANGTATSAIPEIIRSRRSTADRHDESLFNPTDEERALLDRIKQRESSGQYDILHGPGHQHVSDTSAFPQWAGFMGPAGVSHAAGGYGFQPGTYAEMAKLTGRTDFSPESQDINALKLLRQKGTQPWPWLATEGGEKNITPAPLPVKRATDDLKEETKLLEDELKLKEKDFELETINARGNQQTLDDINKRKRAFEEEILVKKQLAIGEAASRTEGLVTGDTTDIQVRLKSGDNEARREQIRSEEQASRLKISALEADRKIADQQEAVDLKGVEGRRSTGQLTIDAAESAEEQIVANHAAAVDAILAKEAQAAQGIEKLSQEIVIRKKELDAQYVAQKQQIEDKADKEHAARAHAIDAEIASSASGAIVDAAWGKGGGLKQALQGFIQQQEKKLLDQAFTKLLDSSGIGSLLEGAGDKLLGFLPGGGAKDSGSQKLTTTVDANTKATVDNTQALKDVTAAKKDAVCDPSGAPKSGNLQQVGGTDVSSGSAQAAAGSGGGTGGALGDSNEAAAKAAAVAAGFMGSKDVVPSNYEGYLTAVARSRNPAAPSMSDVHGSGMSAQEIEARQSALSPLGSQPIGNWGDYQKTIEAHANDYKSLSGWNYIADKHWSLLGKVYGEDPKITASKMVPKGGGFGPYENNWDMSTAQLDAALAAKGLNVEGNSIGTPPQESAAWYYYRNAIDAWPAGRVGVGQFAGEGERAAGGGGYFDQALARDRATLAARPTLTGPGGIDLGIPNRATTGASADAAAIKEAITQGNSQLKISLDQAGQKIATSADKSFSQGSSADKLTVDTSSNTQATQANTQALQQNSQSKSQQPGSSAAPVASTKVPTSGGYLRPLGDFGGDAGGGGDWSSDVPQLDGGGTVSQTGLAVVHAGETVIPAFLGLLKGVTGLFGGGGGSGGGATTGLQGLTGAATQATPALEKMTSSSANVSSAFSGLTGLFGSLFGGGGAGAGGLASLAGSLFGGGGAGAGGLASLATLPLELFALEGGGLIPSAEGGMIVSANGGVGDGKGGRLIIGHPNEMVLPSHLSLGLQDMIGKGGGWTIPRAPAPAALSPDFASGAHASGGDNHTHNWNISGVLNTNDVQRLLMSHSETIAKAGARASRNFSPHAPR